jgi:hypothetical protein
MEYAGRVTVRNSKGRLFQLHEYRGRRLFALKDSRRFVLETGEAVERLDLDNYVIRNTGEPLVRVANPISTGD